MGLLDKLRGTEAKAPQKTVMAAAMPMSGPGVTRIDRGRHRSTTDQWQQEAWYFFDAIGEVRSPLVWIANAVSQADVHATDLDPDTGKPTGPSDDARAQAVAAQAFGGPSQRAGVLRTIALCWQVAGEAWLIIRPRPPKRGAAQPDEWLALSGSKVTAKGTSWQYTDPRTGMEVTLTEQDRLIRIWQPHPNDQARADSSLRPALPICREIEKVSQSIISRLDSRIASAGLAFIADEVDVPRGEFDTTAAAVMDQILTAMEHGIANPGTAAAHVPVIVNAPAEHIASEGVFRLIDMSTALDGELIGIRDNARDRLAQALDAPKQVAEGSQGEGNHWSDWKVEEDTYKIYIEPLFKAIGDAVDEYWYIPALELLGDTQAAQRALGWDTTAIVARPDASETLEAAYDKILISDEYYLAEKGLPIDSVPTDEERTRRFLEKVVLGAPTLLADPAVAEALGLSIEVQPAAAGVDATVSAGGELEPPEPEPAPVRALPAPGDSAEEPEEVPEGLVAAAELIVYDALRRAGGRLLTNQNRGQFKNTPREELHTVIDAGEETHTLLEGSFQFTDRVAEAFGYWPRTLREELSAYTSVLLLNQRAHDPGRLREILAALPKAWTR